MGTEDMTGPGPRVSPAALDEKILADLRAYGDNGMSAVMIRAGLTGDHGVSVALESVERRLSVLLADGRIQVRPGCRGLYQALEQPLLIWDKPGRAQPYEEWAAYQPDDGPPGAWVPNMSDDDRRSWKAKLHGQRAESLYVQVRKSVPYSYGLSQVLIVVHEDGRVVTSQNGRACWAPEEWAQLSRAVEEARARMASWRQEHPA